MHVPFRDSKLTRILKDSLGGNCKTSMIANINPCNDCYEETYNTLKFADRIKTLKTSAFQNMKILQYHFSEYPSIIADLQKKLEDLQNYKKETIDKTLVMKPIIESDIGPVQVQNDNKLYQNDNINTEFFKLID